MDKRRNSLTYVLVGLLVLSGYGAATALGAVDSGDTVLLVGALAGAVIAASFAWPFTRAGTAATIVAAAYFLALQAYRMIGAGSITVELSQARPAFSYAPSAMNYGVPIAVGILCLAVAGLLGGAAARRLSRAEEQLARSTTVIRELTIHDSQTGTLKIVYADTLLSEEIERARRYKRSLSLVLLGPDDWQAVVRERGEGEAMEALKVIGRLLEESLRSVDTISYREQGQFAVILPETAVAGGCVAAERLCHAVAAKTSLMFRAGVAEFPGDAVSKAELLNEADAALKFARSANLGVASRVLLT